MNNGKFIVEISDGGNLKYLIKVKRWEEEIQTNKYETSAEKIDKRYLLRKKTLMHGEIFGIADTRGEADKRIYEAAIKISKNFEKVYGKEFEIKARDITQRKKKSIKDKL